MNLARISRGIAGIVLCLALSPLAAEGQIVKIKIDIDEREYVWSLEGIDTTGEIGDAVEVTENDIIDAETVISFLSVKPGSRVYPDDSLERLCRESELRLQASGYFYEASVQLLPSRKNPLERTILVSVTTGFLWRFGGGNAWGLIGKDSFGGGRNSLRLYAGWNRNGASYTEYRAFGLPLVLGANMFFYAPGDYSGMDAVSGTPGTGTVGSAGITTGWFVHPDLLVSLDAVAGTDSFGADAEWRGSVQGAVSWRKYLVPGDVERYGTESDMGADIRGFYWPDDGARKAELSGFVHGKVNDSSVLAVKTAVGVSDGDAGFNLFMTEDRSVRSGWESKDLFATSFAFASVEARQRIASFTVPPGFECDLQLFAFSDAALIDSDILDAYGAGLRILFDSPVFAYFTFSYGLSREGNGRFIFCGSAGF